MSDVPVRDHDLYYDVIASPLGPIFIGGTAGGLRRIDFLDGDSEQDSVAVLERETGSAAERDPEAAADAAMQLREYFAGQRTHFDLPLAAAGTPFQRRVWGELERIPYGETATYGEVARAIGKPGAPRAVGLANGRNPIAIVVPCHRVVGADGTLTGYGGGLDRKAWLLNLESRPLRPLVQPV